jgi:hypothetical protein
MSRGGTGKYDSRGTLLMIIDQLLSVVSSLERFGSRSGEIGGGIGKPIDSAEYERFNLRPLPSSVPDTKFGVLDTWLDLLDSENACVLLMLYG